MEKTGALPKKTIYSSKYTSFLFSAGYKKIIVLALSKTKTVLYFKLR
jgi:hypothetical protein